MNTPLQKELTDLKDKLTQLGKLSTLLNQAGETTRNASETAAGLADSYQNTLQKLETHAQKKLNLLGDAEDQQRQLLGEFNLKLDQIAREVDTRITNYTGLSEKIGNSTLATLKRTTDQVIERYNNGVAQTLDQLKRKGQVEKEDLNQHREQLQKEINQSIEILKLAHTKYLTQLNHDVAKFSDEMQKLLAERTEALHSELIEINHTNTQKFDDLLSINTRALSDVSTRITNGFDAQNEHIDHFQDSVITNLRTELEKINNTNTTEIRGLITGNDKALTELSAQIIKQGDTQQKSLDEFINGTTEILRKNSELVNPFSERIDDLLLQVKRTQENSIALNDYLRELYLGINERFSTSSSEIGNQFQELRLFVLDRVTTYDTTQKAEEKKREEQFRFVKNCFYATLTGIVIVAGLVIYKLF